MLLNLAEMKSMPVIHKGLDVLRRVAEQVPTILANSRPMTEEQITQFAEECQASLTPIDKALANADQRPSASGMF